VAIGGGAETDPVFVASPAYGITTEDISGWDAKLDIETDPVFTEWLSETPPLYSETDPVFEAWLLATPPLYAETDPVFEAWLLANPALNVLREHTTIYIAPTGNDANSGLDSTEPILTLDELTNRLMAIDIALPGARVDVQIDSMTFDEDFIISGWINSDLSINGGDGTALNYCEIYKFNSFSSSNLSADEADDGFYLANIDSVSINGSISNFYVEACPFCFIANCDVSTTSNRDGITATYGSHVVSDSNTGVCDGYGLVANQGGFIEKTDSDQPTGTSKNEYGFVYTIREDNGDLILPNITPIFKLEAGSVLINDKITICESTTPFTLSIHAASGIGTKHTITNAGTGTITLDPTGSETINGATTKTLVQWETVELYDYDVGKWVIVNS
jgi:hypothetical protein